MDDLIIKYKLLDDFSLESLEIYSVKHIVGNVADRVHKDEFEICFREHKSTTKVYC